MGVIQQYLEKGPFRAREHSQHLARGFFPFVGLARFHRLEVEAFAGCDVALQQADHQAGIVLPSWGGDVACDGAMAIGSQEVRGTQDKALPLGTAGQLAKDRFRLRLAEDGGHGG